jgi:hypothetical protein
MMSASGRTLVVAALLMVGSTLGCSAPSLPEEGLAQGNQELVADDGFSINGLATNGLATNGLATNGLATNGLATNGLATNGLESESFSSWFNEDLEQRNVLMKYLIGCALPQDGGDLHLVRQAGPGAALGLRRAGDRGGRAAHLRLSGGPRQPVRLEGGFLHPRADG